MRSFVALLLLLLAPLAAGGASLVGDTIQGSIEFNGFAGTNFFDPSNGQVPAGSSGIQPSAVVSDVDASFLELQYTDGPCGGCRVNIDVDVDATTVVVREHLINDTLPAVDVLGWTIELTSLDLAPLQPITDAILVSSEFSGLGVAFTATSVTLTYAGGEDIDPFSGTDPRTDRVATVVLVPEPGCVGLLGFGLAALGAGCRWRRG